MRDSATSDELYPSRPEGRLGVGRPSVRPDFGGLFAFVLVGGGVWEGCFPYIPRVGRGRGQVMWALSQVVVPMSRAARIEVCSGLRRVMTCTWRSPASR